KSYDEVVTGSLLMLVGSAILFFIPSYLGYLSSVAHATPGMLGLVSGCETWAIAMASLLSPVWGRYATTRGATLIAVISCLIGNMASLFATDIHLLMIIRKPTGLFEGILYALSFRVLGKAANPVRAMGVASTVLVVVGTTGLWLAPRLSPTLGLGGPRHLSAG